MRSQVIIILLIILATVLFLSFNANNNHEGFRNTRNKKLNFIEETELKKLLRIARDNFTENKIDYGIIGRTLDGAIKYKDIIPGDTEADMAVFLKENTKDDNMEKINWTKSGTVLREHKIGYKLSFIDGKPANKYAQWNFPFVNIHVMKKQEREEKYISKDGYTDLYEDEIFPLKKYQFGDLLLNGIII